MERPNAGLFHRITKAQSNYLKSNEFLYLSWRKIAYVASKTHAISRGQIRFPCFFDTFCTHAYQEGIKPRRYRISIHSVYSEGCQAVRWDGINNKSNRRGITMVNGERKRIKQRQKDDKLHRSGCVVNQGKEFNQLYCGLRIIYSILPIEWFIVFVCSEDKQVKYKPLIMSRSYIISIT